MTTTFPLHVSALFMLAFYGGGLVLIAVGFVLWRKARKLAVACAVLGFVLNAVSFDAQSHKLAIEDGRVVHKGGLIPRAPIPLAQIKEVMVYERSVWIDGNELELEDPAGLVGAMAAADPGFVRESGGLWRHR